MKKKLLGSLFAVGLTVCLGITAHAYTLTGLSSVDGTELAYDVTVSSLWTEGDHARDMWNACCSGVAIKRDSWSSVEDLTLRIGHQPDQILDGYYTTNTAPDSITVNDAYWNHYNEWQKKSVMAHEFGHALGLGEYNTSPRVLMHPKTPERMYPDGLTIIGKPQPDDIAGYNAKW